MFIVLLLALTFLLSILFKPGAASYEPELQKISEQNTVSLTAFLNTKAEVDGQNITMANLARLAKMDSKYQTILKEKSEAILSPVFGSNVVLGIYSLPEFHFYILSPDYNRAIEQISVHIPFPQDPKFRIAFGVVKND
jgi:hypothetical protein